MIMEDLNATQEIPTVPSSSMGRQLWKAARRVAELEYQVRLLTDQRRQLADLVRSLMENERIAGA